MKILLINSTFWPVIGGVETVMRDQAEELARQGHTVTVLAGVGSASQPSYKFELFPELAADYPLNVQVKKAVDHGQTDHYLSTFSKQLFERLNPIFQSQDVIIVHGGLTTHFNFAFTQALWNACQKKPTIAWVNDLTATNQDYSLPFTDRLPWSLMSKRHPTVTYVAVSESRQKEIHQVYGIPLDQIPVIPPTSDAEALFGTPYHVSAWMRKNDLVNRDIIFYAPGKLLQRKNTEAAFKMIATLKEVGISCALLLSAVPDLLITANPQYAAYLRTMPKEAGIEDSVFFLPDHFEMNEATWRKLFLVSDVVLFPSRYEGFGLPRQEAVLMRMPCWVQDIPVHSDIESPLIRKVADPAAAVDEARRLIKDPAFIARKRILQERDGARLYKEKLLPLLEKVAATKPAPEE